MSITASELVKNSSEIRALLEILSQLNRKPGVPLASNTQIADIIQLDPAPSTSLLCDLLTPQDLAQKPNFIIGFLNYG